MPDCCADAEVNEMTPRKYRCPVNGREYRAVHLKTMLHHIRQPWKVPLREQGYFFCSDRECDVVYFGQDGAIIPKSALRTKVGIKEDGADDLVCYCFGVTRQEAERNSSIRSFVADKTKESMCSCETSNPSGVCCLVNFPRQ